MQQPLPHPQTPFPQPPRNPLRAAGLGTSTLLACRDSVMAAIFSAACREGDLSREHYQEAYSAAPGLSIGERAVGK